MTAAPHPPDPARAGAARRPPKASTPGCPRTRRDPRRRGSHPPVGELELVQVDEGPGRLRVVGRPVRVHQELRPRVDGILTIVHRHLEELRHRYRLGRTGLDAETAEDAAEHVDLVDEAVALAWTHWSIGRIVRTADVDAPSRADPRTQLATDALLHPVGVPVENVSPVESLWLDALLLRVLHGHAGLAHLPQRDGKPPERPQHVGEPPHQITSRHRYGLREHGLRIITPTAAQTAGHQRQASPARSTPSSRV